MDYTLHQLRVFLKVADLQSVTKAAEALHLTQPAVSIQLRKLQEQFEVPLFEVIGRQLYITPFGEEIALAARKILEEVDLIRHRTQAYKGELTGALRISIVSTAKYIMPFLLADFSHAHAAIDLEIDVTNKAGVLAHLEKNEIDFALVSVLPEHLQVEKLELMNNELHLVAAADYPVPTRKKELWKEALIFREEGSATLQAMERFLLNVEGVSGKRLSLRSNEAVKQAVLAGLGLSIMPLIGLKHELKQGRAKIVPVKGLPIVSKWNLIWLKGKQHSPVAKAFLSYLKENLQEIITREIE